MVDGRNAITVLLDILLGKIKLCLSHVVFQPVAFSLVVPRVQRVFKVIAAFRISIYRPLLLKLDIVMPSLRRILS